MMEILGFSLLGLLLLTAALLLSPIRYRAELGKTGGFLEISLLFGLYRRRQDFTKKKETEIPADAQDETAPVRIEKETPRRLDPAGRPLPAGTQTAEPADKSEDTGTQNAAENADAQKISKETKPAEAGTAGESTPAAEKGTADAEKSPAETKLPETETAGAASPRRPSAASVFWFAWKNGTIRLALTALGRLLRHSSPAAFEITGRAGLGNPADTGLAAGLTAAALPSAARIEWDYIEKRADLNANARGRIIPLYILAVLLTLALKRSVRQTLAYARGGRRRMDH